MKHIEKIMAPNEDVRYKTRLHWIVIAEGFAELVLFIAVGLFLDSLFYNFGGLWADMYFNYIVSSLPVIVPFSPFALISFAVGIGFFINHLIQYFFTIILLTNKRLITKKGMIIVDVDETDLGEVRAEHIHHGFFGYYLGYGFIHLDCRFVDDVNLKAVKDPVKLVNAIKIAREERVNDNKLSV